MKSDKYYIFCISLIKSFKKFKTPQSNHYNNGRQWIRNNNKTFHFDLPKNGYINLEHEIYFIIKHNKLLAEHAIKNEVRQLLLKYKHGNDIYEHRKQQN